MLFTISFTIGPLLAGFLSLYISYNTIFLINSFTYLAPIIMHCISKIPNTVHTTSKGKNFLNSMYEAVIFTKNHISLKYFIIIVILFHIMAGYMIGNTIIVYYLKSELGKNDFFILIATSIYGMGMFAGILSASLLEKKSRKLSLLVLMLFIILGFVFINLKNDFLICLSLFFISYGIHFFSILKDILIQEIIPNYMIGRIGTLIRSILQGCTVLSMAGVPILNQIFSFNIIFSISLVLSIIIIWIIYHRGELFDR